MFIRLHDFLEISGPKDAWNCSFEYLLFNHSDANPGYPGNIGSAFDVFWINSYSIEFRTISRLVQRLHIVIWRWGAIIDMWTCHIHRARFSSVLTYTKTWPA